MATTSMTLYSMTAYIKTEGAAGQFQLSIYSDNGSGTAPVGLLACTPENGGGGDFFFLLLPGSVTYCYGCFNHSSQLEQIFLSI